MKTESNSRQHAVKLAKYLGGEMNEEESHAFEEKISSSEELQARVEKLKIQWSAMKGYKASKSPDARKAWDKLHDRLEHEKLIPFQSHVVKSRPVINLVRIAAAVLFLLGIGSVVYFYTSRKPAVEMVRVNTENSTNTLIKTLADGSVIYIARNSLFSFPEKFKSGSRNVELKGEAFFDIVPNPGNPFIIETKLAVINVLGTAFNVKTKNGEGFELFVDRGKVKVALKSDPSNSTLVMAGEKISAIKNNLVKSKHIPDEASSWYKQRMQFKDEPLENIIHVLNQNFNTTFAVADNEIGKHKLTMTFQNETVVAMTELICVTLNLKSQTINGVIVFSENSEGKKQN